MIKKILVLFLSLLTLTVEASTSRGLKEIFDDFNYALTVEWDQRDQNFYNDQVRKLSHELTLLSEQGISQAEMVNLVAGEVKSTQVKRDLELVLTSMNLNRISSEEARTLMVDIVARNQAKGANWSGAKIMLGIWGGFFVAVMGLMAWCMATPGTSTFCNSTGDTTTCGCSMNL